MEYYDDYFYYENDIGIANLFGDNDENDYADNEAVWDGMGRYASAYGSQDVWRNCVAPSIFQIKQYILILCGTSFLCRILWRLSNYLVRTNDWPKHIISATSGFVALYLTTGYHCLVVLFFGFIGIVLIMIAEYEKWTSIGVFVTPIIIIMQILFEILYNNVEAWQNIRGIQMIAIMKIISLAFDLDTVLRTKSAGNSEEEKKLMQLYCTPGLIPYLGYIFCPATCSLGPWISFAAYMQSLRGITDNTRRNNYNWLVWIILNILLAISFMSLSNCIVPMMCGATAWQWLSTYRDALAVRTSHYFICFLSQATMAAGGVNLRPNAGPRNKSLDSLTTKPWSIELPRSLGAVVRAWNIPMHEWLKAYIFCGLRNRFTNYSIALLGTYFVSCLLHGLHIKIHLVLLSLAMFTYVETVLRAKLANVFNACIKASPCKGRNQCKFLYCNQRHNWWQSRGALLVLIVNLGFSLLTVINLAYLGVMMNTTNVEEYSDEKISSILSVGDGLLKWKKLHFFSHWIALGSFIFCCLI